MLRRSSKQDILEKKIIMQDLEISDLNLTIDELNSALKKLQSDKQIEELEKTLAEKEEIILKQRDLIGRFKGSVVYPLFRLTSTFGQTAAGKIVRKSFRKGHGGSN